MKKKIESYKSFINVKTQKLASKPIRIHDHIDNSVHIFEFDINTYNISKSSHNIKKSYYIDENDKVFYSKLKPEYENDENYEESPYYWKTPDGWLYLYKPDGSDMRRITITRNEDLQTLESNEPIIIDENIRNFKEECIGETTQSNLRIGINIVTKHYKDWCLSKNIQPLTRKKLKEELIKLHIKEEESKGIHIDGRPGKRGYNIRLSQSQN